jgi:hypothetical protein
MSQWFEPLESRQMFSSPHLVSSASQLVFQQVQGNMTAPQTLTLKNSGSSRLTIKSITVNGVDASAFVVVRVGRLRALGRGASMKLNISFMPFSVAVRGATLQIATNDPSAPITTVYLRGLGVAGLYGANEPSLQRILDTLQIPVNVGDADPSTSVLDGPGPSDEVPLQLMKKAGPGPVKITPLAAYSWNTSPVVTVGWYTHTPTALAAQGLFSIPMGGGQTILPPALGATQFDPGAAVFGLFANWPSETHGATYSEDALNPWFTGSNQHAVRVYPYKNGSGQVVANTYIVAMEQGALIDYQDTVLLVQNVMPATP